MWYVLDEENRPVKSSISVAGEWLDKNLKRKAVKQEYIGDVYVSTVFLGLDHSFKNDKPVLWETMIFGGNHDQFQNRYSSYDDAVIGHQEALNLINNS